MRGGQSARLVCFVMSDFQTVPESIAFAKALAGLAAERPEIRIYEAEATGI